MKNFDVKMNEYLPLRDVVFNTLRSAILKGELEPGERLMEIALANKLGVSRTPIREAIRKLELEGLVIMIPRKGAEVARITEKDLRDVLEVRASLEKLAAELACERITAEEIDQFKEKARIFRKAIADKTIEITVLAQKDVDFHDVIFGATKNARLIQLLNNLREQMYRYRLEFLKDRNTHEQLADNHDAIMDAIIRRDKIKAAELVEKHIYYQELGVIEKLQLQDDGSSAESSARSAGKGSRR